MSMTSLLSLKNVSFSYDKTTGKDLVIDGLSLDVDAGEFLAITGPSGSGKSTILSLMAGLKTPRSGHILFEGRNLAGFSETEKSHYLNCSIGMIYQFFNLIPSFSALDNVMAPAIIRGTKGAIAKERATSLLCQVGLEKKTKTKAFKLSGGQQQRAAIARALINEPRVILADEPTGNLDKASTRSIVEMLRQEQKQRNIALVVVTHDAEVASLADRLFEL